MDYFSFTGDSAVYVVDAKMTIFGPTITDVTPHLIGNIITERNDVVVKPLIDLSGLPEDNIYSDFFKQRYNIMKALIVKQKILTEF